MKKILLIALLFCFGKAYGQQNGSYNSNPGNNYASGRARSGYTTQRGNGINTDNDYDQIRISDSIQEIRADILPFKKDPKIKNDRYYFWYMNNVIHSTQGGYNGQLLNGHYISYYRDKNLKEEGSFDRGLKQGEWKTWNTNGDLTSVTNWSDGVQVTGNPQPFWKKVPFINKKNDQQQQSQPAETPGGNQ